MVLEALSRIGGLVFAQRWHDDVDQKIDDHFEFTIGHEQES
jgi:hypothetical protein